MIRPRLASAAALALAILAAIAVPASGTTTKRRTCFYHANSGWGLWATRGHYLAEHRLRLLLRLRPSFTLCAEPAGGLGMQSKMGRLFASPKRRRAPAVSPLSG